jgi:hypothetical protein
MGTSGVLIEQGNPRALLKNPKSYLATLHQAALDELGYANRDLEANQSS